MRPLSNEINAIFVYEVICRVCESKSVSSARTLYLVNLLVAVWCRWKEEAVVLRALLCCLLDWSSECRSRVARW